MFLSISHRRTLHTHTHTYIFCFPMPNIALAGAGWRTRVSELGYIDPILAFLTPTIGWCCCYCCISCSPIQFSRRRRQFGSSLVGKPAELAIQLWQLTIYTTYTTYLLELLFNSLQRCSAAAAVSLLLDWLCHFSSVGCRYSQPAAAPSDISKYVVYTVASHIARSVGL